jgi:hypothetical protein
VSDSIKIKIEGIGVRRETVDVADLFDILRAIRATVAEGEDVPPKGRAKKGQGYRT